MKKIFLLFLFASLTMSFSNSTRDQKRIIKKVLLAAQAGYKYYLEKIPIGEESFYGLNNRKEFSLVKLGTPYQKVTLKNSFYNDANVPKADMIESTEQWLIPLKVNGENRALITVAKKDGNWKVITLGSAELAKELSDFEKNHLVRNKNNLQLMRVYKPVSDYIIFTNKNSSDQKVFPLKSAKDIIAVSDKSKSEFTLSEIFSAIKERLSSK